ncbi:unconventional myosin-XVIIIa isoform X2 [Apis florea]|uniref:unconventional myosin-XVIIIa isoform X2 n=1 Tax=Apis florea TaxID=7463 RepID=UPI0012FF4A4B|nr:unconventional myosin-XVIIIa isoform X2 [Apis florea]
MQLEYKTMENNLSAEVKLAAGKLNALEDWRIARLDLMNKFEKQEKEMAEQEMRHKEELYEAEKSIVTKKDMMQKEMKEQLQILSERLLKAVTLRITEIINRTIRENVALNRDLDKLLETNKKLETINIGHKKLEEILKLKCQMYEKEAEITENKIVKQRNEMHKIVENFEFLLIYYGNAERSNVRLKRLEDMLEDKIKENNMLEKKIKLCEKNIMKAKDESERLSKLTAKRQKELKSLKIVLDNATTFLNKAIEIDKFECTYLSGSLGLIEPVISSRPAKKKEKKKKKKKGVFTYRKKKNHLNHLKN